MKSKKIILAISSIFLFSCQSLNTSFIRYGVNKPFITLEESNQETGVLIDISPTEIKQKIDQGDTYMLYIHAAHCGYCSDSKQKFLDPYLSKNRVVIYGIDLDDYPYGSDERTLFSEEIKPMFGKSYIGTPYYALFENGSFLMGEQDSSYFSLFFKTYIITD